MGAVRDFAAQLLSGAVRPEEQNPFTTFLGLEEYAPGVAFVSGFANAVAIDTGEGLVVVDTGSQLTGAMIHGAIRGWTRAPADTIVYTHGHADHVMGASLWDDDSASAGGARPTVIAHELVPKRFERYVKTAGYNAAINARQFRVPGLQWPTQYRQPDVLVSSAHTISKGGVTIELRHDRGETDDHLWAYVEPSRAICTGDLVIWASPNCGNPQKVQRYPL